MLPIVDLFAGACGGWSLGMHRAGFETVAACELDEWRRAEFSRKFPRARMYADVRQLTGDILEADGAFPRIIVGSPPCQDASTANHNGKGVDGPRTGLFFEAIRLVGECRPDWVCFENVPGLRTRGYDRVHDALEVLGYEIRPLVVGAWHTGAPHRRNRVWIIANIASFTDSGSKQCFSGNGEMAWISGFSSSNTCGTDAVGRHSDRGRIKRAKEAGSDARHPNCTGLEVRSGIGRDTCSEQPSPERTSPCDAIAVPARQQMGRTGQPWQENQRHNLDSAPLHRTEIEGHQPDRLTEWSEGWTHWNGGFASFGQLDDGLPKGMARRMLSAFGDAVTPIIPELIGRFILSQYQERKVA